MLECKNCAYCYKKEDEEFARCHYEEELGRESTWMDVPPCEEEETYADMADDYEREEREDYEKDRKPLLDLLKHMDKKAESDPNWDSSPLVFGYDGRMAITYDAYAYDIFRKAIVDCLHGIDQSYGYKWKEY